MNRLSRLCTTAMVALILPIWLMLVQPVAAQILSAGDVNGDGAVNVIDVQLTVNVALGVNVDPTTVSRADLNGDGVVNVVDVQRVVNIVLNGNKVILFDEQFRAPGGGASNMAINWTVSSGGPCTASNTDQDVQGFPPQGNPTPGLVLKCQGPILNPIGGSLQSLASYVLNTPLTFAVDARVDTFIGTGINPQLGMGFLLTDVNSGLNLAVPVAAVWISPTEATFYINNGSFGDTQVTRSFSADALFHRYAFAINGQGNAEWRRDGFLQANTANFSTTAGNHQNTGNFFINMTPPPSDPSEGHFDNVLVTAP